MKNLMKRISHYPNYLCGVLLLIQISLLLPSKSIAEQPDSIYYNGKFLTANAEFAIAQAVATKDGRFLQIGKTDELRALAGSDTKQIDLGGKQLFPGSSTTTCTTCAGPRGGDTKQGSMV